MNKSQHIFITGASAGIGRSTALLYAQKGNRLTLIGRDEKRLDEVQKLCREKGAKVSAYSADVSDIPKITKITTDSDRAEAIDTIILCAGITVTLDGGGSFESPESSSAVLMTNLISPLSTINTLIPQMQMRKRGHIVLVSSLAAYYGNPYTPSYSASKSGLKTYGEAVRQFLKSDNITVSIVLPGFVDTSMSNRFQRPKPFMISCEKAAEIIYQGILRKKAYIRFPLLLQLMVRIQSVLPYRVADLLIKMSGYGRKIK